MPRGTVALKAGRRLGPADIGLLAALGLAEVPVRRRLSIALLSTGERVPVSRIQSRVLRETLLKL